MKKIVLEIIAKKWLVFLVLGVIIICLFFLKSSKKGEEISFLVKRCDIKQIVSATGSLKPAKEINLASQISGQIKKINFSEGEKAEKGAVIVEIDNQEILTQIDQTKAEIESLQENLAKLKRGASQKEKSFYQAKLEASKKSLKQAKDNLKNTEIVAETTLKNLYQDVYSLILSSWANSSDAINRKLDPLFIDDKTSPKLTFKTSSSQAKIDLIWQRRVAEEILNQWKEETEKIKQDDSEEKLDEILDISEKNLKEIEKIFPLARDCLDNAIGLEEGTLSSYKDLLNLAENEVLSSLEEIQAKKQAISLQKKNNKKSIDSAKNAYELAKANFELAKREFELKTSPAREEEIKSLEAQIKSARAKLAGLYIKLEKTKIKAPMEGTITEILSEIGDFVGIGQRVVGFMVEGKKEIEVNISEADIAKIKTGQKAKIDFDALGPEEKFSGEIVSVNPASTVISGVVYYKVKIFLEKDDPRLKPGMTANIDILTARKDNVLCLPYQFIEEEENKKFVYKKEGEKIIKKEIKTGLEGENNVEILAGLKEGDKIVLK